MFPTLEVIVMLEQRQVARAVGNVYEDPEYGFEWNASRHVDSDIRATILYALAAAAVAQVMTEPDLEEFCDTARDLFHSAKSGTLTLT